MQVCQDTYGSLKQMLNLIHRTLWNKTVNFKIRYKNRKLLTLWNKTIRTKTKPVFGSSSKYFGLEIRLKNFTHGNSDLILQNYQKIKEILL